MQTVKINLPLNNSYKIAVGIQSLKTIPEYLKPLKLSSKGVLITDRTVNRLYGEVVITSLKKAGYQIEKYVVPAGEKSKSLSIVEAIYKFLNKKEIERKSFIIALGGGVIGDLAGFIASTYKRGISFIQIPTTLLAQVDSSVGGKVAVNIPQGKNCVGAFYQPKTVLINFDVLKTLPQKQISNGLAEIIKYGIIQDPKLFRFLEKNINKVFRLNKTVLEKIISRSCQIKGKIVEQDEKESGLREILNFGHTIGHSLEEVLLYKKISHGEAVGVGMVAAAILSQQQKNIKEVTVTRIIKLIQKAKLPITFQSKFKKQVIDFLKYDKKIKQGKNKFVLIEKLGLVSFGNEVSNSEVEQALDTLLLQPKK